MKDSIFLINIQQKLFTKVIKNAKLEGFSREIKSSIKRGGGAQALKVWAQNCLIKIRECFTRANICNQSKLLHDTSLTFVGKAVSLPCLTLKM
jgi:hypothetical protein